MIKELKQLRHGCAIFQKHEKRDPIYRAATFLIEDGWFYPPKIANGLGVLLLVWNNAAYRYGTFDFGALENCVKNKRLLLEQYRTKKLEDFSAADEKNVLLLFNDFSAALEVIESRKRSPVGVAKAMHLLAPNFFPLWDKQIAKTYGHNIYSDSASKYLEFMKQIQAIVKKLSLQKDLVDRFVNDNDKTILKLIDEYNYAHFTKNWVLEK